MSMPFAAGHAYFGNRALAHQRATVWANRLGLYGFEVCKAWMLRLLCPQVSAKFMETGGECPWSAQFFAESMPHMVWVACADGSIECFNRRTLDCGNSREGNDGNCAYAISWNKP